MPLPNFGSVYQTVQLSLNDSIVSVCCNLCKLTLSDNKTFQSLVVLGKKKKTVQLCSESANRRTDIQTRPVSYPRPPLTWEGILSILVTFFNPENVTFRFVDCRISEDIIIFNQLSFYFRFGSCYEGTASKDIIIVKHLYGGTYTVQVYV